MQVLIVEDNDALAVNIGEYLEQQGDEPDFASDGALGLRLCQSNRYDAVILDLRLPRLDGVELCRRLRAENHDDVSVLMLTARDTVDHRIEGLEAGADDYLTKPFALRELYLRLQAIVRRRSDHARRLRVGELCMDLDQRLVFCHGEQLELAPIGFQILELLMRASPGLVSRTEIENAIWQGDPPGSEAALRGHIHRLRHLIEEPADTPLIRTVHGIGYQLAAAG